MNPLQPPKISDKVPIEAYSLIMQPEAMNMLRGVNGFQLISLFYFQMPFMLKPKDVDTLEKGGQKLITAMGGCVFLGVLANVQLKRLHKNFLKWPVYSRIPVRLGIMAVPFALLNQILIKRSDQILVTINKITRKKNVLLRNKDLEEYFDVEKDGPVPKQKKK